MVYRPMVEKRVPHHDLAAIKAAFSTSRHLRMTGVAQRDSRAMGYGSEDVLRVIQSISHRQFYKSMTANHNPQAWQDVYHATDGALTLYVKFTDNGGGVMTILSFKEK